ncbi:hypothetical protein A4X06_0g8630 [Tilletia controversa]|uniref:Uncharacterized protein n=1 Tax=Tilletia controversa TaxID=13291 RepID=A0A8X7MJZ4_9BASI|nr:hypothetical protein A4X06_0g8630 [Tilletia controversa]
MATPGTTHSHTAAAAPPPSPPLSHAQSVSRPRPYHHAYNTHISAPLQLPSKQGHAETDSSGPLPLAYVLSFHPLPTHLRPQLLFALAHLTLGTRLRVSGQVRESLAVTGLGYLVGFDHIVDARRRRNVEEKALGSPFRASAPVKEGVCAHQPRPSPASPKPPTCSFPPSTSNNSVTMPPFPPRARPGQYLHNSSLGS